MFCTECGKKIDDDAAFCTYCGAPSRHCPNSPKTPPSTRKARPATRKMTRRTRRLLMKASSRRPSFPSSQKTHPPSTARNPSTPGFPIQRSCRKRPTRAYLDAHQRGASPTQSRRRGAWPQKGQLYEVQRADRESAARYPDVASGQIRHRHMQTFRSLAGHLR